MVPSVTHCASAGCAVSIAAIWLFPAGRAAAAVACSVDGVIASYSPTPSPGSAPADGGMGGMDMTSATPSPAPGRSVARTRTASPTFVPQYTLIAARVGQCNVTCGAGFQV
jgi:hypothetical protein